MKPFKIAALAGTMMFLATFSPILGQQSKDVTFQVTLLEWYDLYISPTTITFSDIAPTISENPPPVQIGANENPVDVRAFAIIVPASTLRLTATANNDFHTTIPASTVSWTASGTGYNNNGQLEAGTAVTVGQWSGSIFHWHAGQLYFSFYRNYLNQQPGEYSITVTFALSKV